MAGTWTGQNKVLPGAYLNVKTNTPLSIMLGDRGVVVLMQALSVGTKGQIYTITPIEAEYPTNTTPADKKLVNEVLKGANKVLLYNLGAEHDIEDITEALASLRTISHDVLIYPYESATIHLAIANWVKAMAETEGINLQCVLPNYVGDSELVINVAHAVKLADDSTLTIAETTAWVGGVTAGANINQSNTGRKYVGAIDVVPRMTKTEMESAITTGKFIFKVDAAQNVTVVSDINSLTTVTVDKSKVFTKNRVIRTVNAIKNDITNIFESNYVGKINNNEDGRMILRSALIEYFGELQRLNAIQNFVADDVTVLPGADSDSVVIECYVQVVDSVEKMYITVNLV